MRPDYCPIGGQPCQSLCETPCTTPPQRIPQDVPQIPQEHSSNESAYQRGYLERMAKRPRPLTDEQIALIVAECSASAHKWDDFSFARAIEAAHDIKEKP